ncbi:molybdopterin-dependent oxidoreductase [Nonomuraea sp. MCN248]|uniref:Molybdopterin-dependent oxidoreductase n=1 Tax=Nonomuraea corallina TaxID=2989783 RepID=A0ABT4SKH2_9ACTN|nr:molybdopterin-dependent oxidoreductase [Nonomuraea corallina]MDA0637712.1 molybdopterin-dependent oxidoreductase [Nonomuraea corallina]
MGREQAAPAWAGALTGIVAGAVALGVAQLGAGLIRAGAFPVLAVGDWVVDLSPAPLKEFAIRTFGENDKNVLVGGVLVVLALVAAGIGVAARRRPAYGTAGLAAFGAVGLAAVLTRPGATAADALPTLAGVVAGACALSWLLRRATPPQEAGPLSGTPVQEPAGTAERPAVMRAPGVPAAFDRRRLLTGAAGGVVAAGATAFLGRSLAGVRVVDAARVRVTLPPAAHPAPPLPSGTDLRIGGLSPFVTPNADFYRVDTALIVPQVDPRTWTLRVHGLVDRPIEITYDDLLRRPLVEADITLACVSNEVGGPYVGNARWLGVRMADVLREAGVRPEADMLLSTSRDGFTCGTPVDVILDGRDALFAIGMNGEALPVDHGFPVRQVVPGLYGYVSATKWVVDVKVTRFDRDEAYWTPRGWAAKGPIKTQSRIDVPRAEADLKTGRTTIAGVAWAQHTGVDAVEVRVDRGPWRQARLAQVPGPDTWRQWALDWDATPGDHTIEVRATDAAGRTQTEQRTPVAPDGATGWHTINVHVT